MSSNYATLIGIDSAQQPSVAIRGTFSLVSPGHEFKAVLLITGINIIELHGTRVPHLL